MDNSNTIQKIVNETEAFGTVSLQFDEYRGPLVIDKPLILDGNNSTIYTDSTPVLQIKSQRVRIRNLRIELIFMNENDPNTNGNIALEVAKDIKVQLENISIIGNVKGLVNEEGTWKYPEVLNLNPMAEGCKNYYRFYIEVPVSCVLICDMEEVEIQNPGLSPGINEVYLTVHEINKRTILFGEIEIKTVFLKRIISIHGGVFTSSEWEKKSDKKSPILIGINNEIEKSITVYNHLSKINNTNVKKKTVLYLLMALTVIFIGIYWVMVNTRNRDSVYDQMKPSAKIEGFNYKYDLGDTISYQIAIEDDHFLKRVVFEIKNTDISKTWENIHSQQLFYEDKIDTSSLKPDDYRILLIAEDVAENETRITSEWILVDNQPPVIELSEMERQYTIGDKVLIEINVYDNDMLERIEFDVENSDVKKIWRVNSISTDKSIAFSTKGWSQGEYVYSLNVTDASGNDNQVKGSFLLKQKQFGRVNIITNPWSEIYIDDIQYGGTPISIELQSGKHTIRFVNNEAGIDLQKEVIVKPNRVNPMSFQLR